MSRPIKLFFSYSHKDEALRDQLAAHLRTLERKKVIDAWYDRKILPGSKWERDIGDNLNSADIILLLISPDFLNSDYCSEQELEQAMERHKAGQACVIPVILRYSDWQDEPFAALQALPKNAKPIVTWDDRDEAFLDVVQGIRRAIKALQPLEVSVPSDAVLQEIKESGQGEQEYRDDVLVCLRGDGTISGSNRNLLDRLCKRLELSSERARRIEDEAIQDVQDYRQTLIEFLQEHRSMTPPLQDQLNRLQQRLKLRDEDVSAIEKNLPKLFTFKFDVITIDVTGVEIDRRLGQADYFWEELAEGIFLDMVSIPAGEFLMGSPESEAERDSDESPQHLVKVPSFFMSKFAVTQEQWAIVAKLPKVKSDLDSDPSEFKGAKRPVEKVSWHEAVEFCDRLSKKTGKSYRLPSEAEWEYACRACTKTPFHFGETITTDLANYDGNYTYGEAVKGIYREQTIDVGSFPPNAFGLYDMHGNVWEWCADPWHENYDGAPRNGQVWQLESDRDNNLRLLRGGSWLNYPRFCRSADRVRYVRVNRDLDIGFRVVFSVPRTP